jgi:hypothetical protein
MAAVVLRSRPEWVGDNPDQALPAWVFRRLLRKQGGRCGSCTRLLKPGSVTREHVRPIWAGGENRENNIQLWCTVPCSSAKTVEEAPRRAKADRALSQHLGLKRRKGRPMPGTKASGWKRKLDGSWERR